jgi:cytoskeletal protein RodZ
MDWEDDPVPVDEAAEQPADEAGDHSAEDGPAGLVVPSPGAVLSAARLRSGATLDAIARRTRVSRTHLAAIEDDDWDALPAMVYVRGFIRLFAREVGVDPEVPIALLDHHVAEQDAISAVARANALDAMRQARTDRIRVRTAYAAALVTLIAVFLAALFSLDPQPLEARDLDASTRGPAAGE